jgi:diguanylate cyclase (GGDEF)-like protein/PAS domain S-box-containing protein
VHYEREARYRTGPRQVMGDLIPDIGADGAVAGFYLMALDITERKNAELHQAASEKRLKLLTDNLPVLIAYLDRERKFQFLNATFQHWFGIDPHTLIGRHLAEGIGAEQYRTAEPHLDQAYRGQAATYELRARIGDSLHTLETTFLPELSADGEVLGIYSLTHDTTRMKEIEERLTQLARVDSLTGIANRLRFEEVLHGAILRVRRNRRPLALAYLDIDYFKEINDTLGHGAGDQVLKEFAARLVASVRASDTVARLAGDEFVIVFEQVATVEEAGRLAGKIVDAMHAPFTLDGAPRHVSTSIGLALHDGDDETPAALLARADSALYTAKRNGRDGYAIAD